METAIPMLLFFASLFGFGMLILICMQQSKDLEQADREAALKSGNFNPAAPPFLANMLPETMVIGAEDDSFIRSFEQYLQEQQVFATHFVDEPSLANLYCRKDPEVPRRAFERIEKFLKKEQGLVKEFLSQPSVERLYHRLAPPAPAS